MKMKKYLTKFQNGFTLLELLVVIGIIGVLMALATVAYSTAQIGGRNSRRKQDLVAIQNALEQYYSVSTTFSYPVGLCNQASGYMKSAWPVDPNTGAAYAGSTTCAATTYCICAVMEPAGATSGNSGSNCAWNADKTNFCVANLQ